MNITHRIREHALTRFDEVALVFVKHSLRCDTDQISWRELNKLIDDIAFFFQQSGSRQPIALNLSNSPSLIICFLAIARAGREALLCDPQWPQSQLNAVLENLNPQYIITTDQSDAYHYKAMKRLIVNNLTCFSDLRACFSTFDFSGEQPATHLLSSADDMFYCGFTSGSTGVPKGFRRTHASWLASFETSDVEFDIGTHDCVLAAGSLIHSLHLYAVVHALYAGAKTMFAAQFQPALLADLIKRENISVIYGTPTQLDMIAKTGVENDFCSINRVLVSGDALNPLTRKRIKNAFSNAQIDTFYGASELSFISIAKERDHLPEGCAGHAAHGVTITIRDAQGKLCSQEQEGFVCVSSPLIFSRYANQKDDRLLRFEDAVSVGDRGFLDAQNNLFLTGRFERLLIVAGRNIAPEGLEKTLLFHPLILEAAIIPLRDRNRGQRLAAVIKYENDADLTRDDIMNHMRLHHAEYEVPRYYFECLDWPYLSSGKTDFHHITQQIEQKTLPILS